MWKKILLSAFGLLSGMASAQAEDTQTQENAASTINGGNVAIIRQTGGSNKISITQSGSTNQAITHQDGENNELDVKQSGDENSLEATQLGENNTLKREQTGNSRAVINQNGEITTIYEENK